MLSKRAPSRVLGTSLCFVSGVKLGRRLSPAHDGKLLSVMGRVQVCTLTFGTGNVWELQPAVCGLVVDELCLPSICPVVWGHCILS